MFSHAAYISALTFTFYLCGAHRVTRGEGTSQVFSEYEFHPGHAHCPLFFPVCTVVHQSLYFPNNLPSLSPSSQGFGFCRLPVPSSIFCPRSSWGVYGFKYFHRYCCCLEGLSSLVGKGRGEGLEKRNQPLSRTSENH